MDARRCEDCGGKWDAAVEATCPHCAAPQEPIVEEAPAEPEEDEE